MKTARALQLLGLVVIVAVSFFLTVPVGVAAGSNVYDMCVLATFAMNGVIVLSLLVDEVRRRPYSMAMIHWVFCLFFFVFAPASQYITRNFPWGVQPSDGLVLRCNVICLIWTACFAAGLRWKNMHKYLARIRIITVVGGGDCSVSGIVSCSSPSQTS